MDGISTQSIASAIALYSNQVEYLSDSIIES